MHHADLSGRVAVVTGANQGIGAAVAKALAAEGASVLLTYLRLHPHDESATPSAYGRMRARDGQEVAREIADTGGTAAAVEADLADTAAPSQVFDEAERRFGPVEILVNNASGWLADSFLPPQPDRFGRSLRTVDAPGFETQFAVDAKASALLITEFAGRHVERAATWGRIVGLTSDGRDGFPGEVSYGAAKAAMESYTYSAAHELGRYGVTANVVHPPITDTGWVNEAVRREAERTGPLHHVARPEQVAGVVAWLCTDAAGLVTAQRLQLH